MSFPAGVYDFWRGETSLVKPVKGALDVALREFCEGFGGKLVMEALEDTTRAH